ncbi:MAG: hypothetical protein GY934_14920, partial [Gammaproteobacteria bacterium]|nr:hypothetical protein [Gammaproteobacteria bacterium]
GTVWKDNNSNGVYDSGEGINGVTVMPDSGAYYAVTGNAGGYSIPITSAGSYTVTFSGGGLKPIAPQVVVGSDSVLLDLLDKDSAKNDFNGDKKSDILIRHTSGQLYMYEMDGNVRTGKNVGGLSTVWSVEGISDFGGDGKADILIRHTSGQLYMYEMDGNVRTGKNVGGLSTAWSVEGISDFG